jgi:hypothetical protein
MQLKDYATFANEAEFLHNIALAVQQIEWLRIGRRQLWQNRNKEGKFRVQSLGKILLKQRYGIDLIVEYVLQQFRQGGRGQMVIIHRIISKGGSLGQVITIRFLKKNKNKTKTKNRHLLLT